MINMVEDDVAISDVEAKVTEKKIKEAPPALSNFEHVLQLIDELKTTLLQSAEINSTMIQQVKDEIAAGKYQINSQLIAEKLLELTELQTKNEPELV